MEKTIHLSSRTLFNANLHRNLERGSNRHSAFKYRRIQEKVQNGDNYSSHIRNARAGALRSISWFLRPVRRVMLFLPVLVDRRFSICGIDGEDGRWSWWQVRRPNYSPHCPQNPTLFRRREHRRNASPRRDLHRHRHEINLKASAVWRTTDLSFMTINLLRVYPILNTSKSIKSASLRLGWFREIEKTIFLFANWIHASLERPV